MSLFLSKSQETLPVLEASETLASNDESYFRTIFDTVFDKKAALYSAQQEAEQCEVSAKDYALFYQQLCKDFQAVGLEDKISLFHCSKAIKKQAGIPGGFYIFQDRARGQTLEQLIEAGEMSPQEVEHFYRDRILPDLKFIYDRTKREDSSQAYLITDFHIRNIVYDKKSDTYQHIDLTPTEVMTEPSGSSPSEASYRVLENKTEEWITRMYKEFPSH